MAESQDTSRRSTRRGSQRSKTIQRQSAMSTKSRSTTSRNQQRSTRRTRKVIKPQSFASSLPLDLWTRLLPFLTWRDTSAMCNVCCEWRQVVTGAKKVHPEWRSTVLGPVSNGFESLKLLRTNHLKWADTRFAPDLVLLSAASKDPSPWHSGGYWEQSIAAIEDAKLLPPTCKIVGVFTMNAVLGTSEEEIEERDPSAVILSISVAHLPETTVEMAEFDRKDLRRCRRGVELDNPFTAVDEIPSFMLFGVNDQSTSQLVSVLEEWYPGAAVVGAVSPLIDRCIPLAIYCGGSAGNRRDRKPRKNRDIKQQPQRSIRCRSRPGGQVAFPSTILLRFHGNIGMKAFSSSGYHPITPVIRCERARIAEELSQVVTYELVSMLSHDGSEDIVQHRIMDLLEPSERFAIEQEGRGLNIFSCADSEPLEHLFECCNINKSKRSAPNNSQIDRLEFVFWLQNGLMSLPGLCWEKGAYGILASHNPARTSHALTKALRSTQASVSSVNGHAFGAFVVAGALNEIEDPVHAKEVSHLCVNVFQEFHFGGCVVSTSVGPVAFPGCLQPPVVRSIAQVQTHTTCGAVFYTKA